MNQQSINLSLPLSPLLTVFLCFSKKEINDKFRKNAYKVSSIKARTNTLDFITIKNICCVKGLMKMFVSPKPDTGIQGTLKTFKKKIIPFLKMAKHIKMYLTEGAQLAN